MHRVSLDALPWEEQHSPTKKFHSFFRNLSLALGGIRNTGIWGGGHPFDLQIRRIPAGASVCPFHSHVAQWELFVVLAGTGTVRAGGETHAIKTGDVFIHPPGEPHQLVNSGTGDLEVLIVTDNPPLDACYYPDSDKWALRPPMKFFRMTEVDYFDGEDEPVPGAAPYPLAPAPAAAPVAPFASRKIHPDDLPWESWDSPGGKFFGTSKELSIALGAKRKTPPGLGGHPFDLELSKFPPGKSGCPFHRHAAQWELYYILAGTGTARCGDERHVVKPGDVFLHPPGEAHQLINTGEVDLEFFLVADNPPVDYWYYPDSKKWGLPAPRMFFRPEPLDYHYGEE